MSRPGLPLRMLLLGLVGIPLLALIAALGFDTYRMVDRDIDDATRITRRIAERASLQTATFLDSSEHLLAELARRPRVRAMNRAGCDRLLAELKSLQPNYANALTLDAAGRLVCSGAPPASGATAGPDPRYYFDEVTRTRRFTVGKPAQGFITGRWVSTLAYPVLDDSGALLGVVGLPVDLASYRPVVSAPRPPPGTVVEILNGDGVLIAHSDEQARQIGTVQQSDAARAILELRNGNARLKGLGEAERFYSFTAIPGSDWIAIAGTDAALVLEPARRAAVRRILFVLAVLGAVLGLTLYVKRRIEQPLEAIADTVGAVRRGDRLRRASPAGARELVDIAVQLNAMLDAQERMDAGLRESESVFRSVFENTAIGMTLTDMQGRVIRCNPALARMLGYAETELAGRLFSEFTHPDDDAENQRLYRSLVAGEIGDFGMEKRYLRKDGATVWVQLNVSRVEADGGAAPFSIGMMEDISARKRAEQSLREGESRFRGILEGMTVGFVALDRDWRFTFVNPRAAEILARDAQSLLGKRYLDAFPEAAGSPFELAYRKVMEERVTLQHVDYFAPWKRWFEQRIDPTPEGISVFFQDVTERRQYESRIEYLATHDGLTDLPNRNLIHDRITQAISHARRTERQIAVLYLDLDRFKVINDGFGHPFGDAVLKAAGGRLAAVVREGDTVARQSGDEFLILLSDLRRSTDVYIVAQKILEAFGQPLVLQEREIHLSLSIGISLFPQDGQTAEALIGNADVAMYRAKELGRNAYQFFTREMSDESQRRVEIETELRSAVSRGQLQLAYQPKVDLASGRIAGCEALLRWTHPTLGQVSPARFIPVAEESGLIVPIGDWVLRTACAQGKAWTDAGLAPIVIAVNLSARQFLQQDVVAWVTEVLGATRLPPAQLELELTESLIAQDVEKVIATVNRLKEAGVRMAIDDFGTGYSSLSYLKRFRFDTLKIDQSFVRNMTSEVDDATIALAVIALAHNMRMTAVAEGVETQAQCRFLRLNRCDAMQGYFFSKPVPADEMAAMLKSGKTLGA